VALSLLRCFTAEKALVFFFRGVAELDAGGPNFLAGETMQTLAQSSPHLPRSCAVSVIRVRHRGHASLMMANDRPLFLQIVFIGAKERGKAGAGGMALIKSLGITAVLVDMVMDQRWTLDFRAFPPKSRHVPRWSQPIVWWKP